MNNLKYKVLVKLGDHIDTDVMTPGKYLTSYTHEHLASICFKDLDPDFQNKMKDGGFLIAGENFGCGSSRETAPIALKAAGVKAVIAEEFARIFYRNALNIGLPCIVCPNISSLTEISDELSIDLINGTVYNHTKGIELKGTPIPKELIEQFEAGGLIPFLKKKIENKIAKKA